MSAARPFRLTLVPALALLAAGLSAEEVAPAPAPAAPAAEAAKEGETVKVVGKHDTDVYPGRTSTASKGNVPTLESTRRTDVITRDLISEVDATSATELWKLVPNAVESERGTVIVRGFTLDQRPVAGAQLFDGMRASVYNLVPVNLYNIERVEVLKGPDGVMYGQGQPGGVVNYVLKKPQRENFNEISTHVDSYGKRQVAADSTGTLAKTDAGDFLYRVNVAGEQSETFRQYEQFKSLRFAPSLTWVPGDSTSITLLTEVFQDTRTGGRGYGTPVRQGDVFAMPRDYTISDPNDFRKTRGGDAHLQLSQDLSEQTVLSANLFASRCWYFNQYHEGMRTAAEDAADNPVYRRQYRDQSSDTRVWGYDVHVAWERPSDSVAHRVLVGTDLTRIVDPQFPAIDSAITNPFVAVTNTDGASPLNLDNPYALPGGTGTYGIDSGEEGHGKNLEMGAYANYRIGFSERLFIDLGARYDDFRQRSWSFNKLTGGTNFDVDSRDHHLNYDAGVAWRFVPDASLYYAYSSGLAAQGYTTISNVNGPFDPLEWYQQEVGIQGEAFDRQLGAALCVFQITRNHDLVPDTSPGAPAGASIDVGETRSEGVEATVRGKFAANTMVSLAYGYCHAFVRETTQNSTFNGATLQDSELAGVPKHTANITLGHTLHAAPIRLTAGATYIATRPGRLDQADPLYIDLPWYYTVDVAATYLQPSWQGRLGVTNVFDRDYVVLYRATGHQVNRGDPTTFTGSVTAWF